MIGKEKVIEKIIAEIDWYVIEKVRELRKGKFSQVGLSIEMRFAEGFVGRVENPKLSATYNSRHINIIAKILGVKISDILPATPFTHDLVRLTIKISKRSKPRSGEHFYEVIKKTPLSEKEIELYNKRVLNRVSKRKPAVKKKK